MIIVTPQQMKEIERIAETDFGLTSAILIERAAAAVLEVLEQDFENPQALKIFFLAGAGNNGKDALKLAKMLGMKVNKYPIEKCEVVVDGMFGTGLNRPISDVDAALINMVNHSGLPVYAIDIPSGVDGLTGNVRGVAIKATKTITFFGAKPGILFGDGKDCAGGITVHDLGIPMSEKIRALITLQQANLDNNIFSRKTNSHKGSYGRVLCIAGSNGMRGAPALCAMGAFAAGAGLVYVATTERVWNTVSLLVPSAIGLMMEETEKGTISEKSVKELLDAAKNVDVIIVGPGMVNSKDTFKIVKKLLKSVDTPMILDADALNAIEKKDLTREVIITPHLVELERLSEVSKQKITEDRLTFVRDFSKTTQCVTLLKGAGTIISSPRGETAINTNGNPGMAVAGSGDVLSGMIAALVAQGLPLYNAALGGAFLHGLAGDLAAQEQGMLSLLPIDIVKNVSKASLILKERMPRRNGVK